jgi:hypothetical protein
MRLNDLYDDTLSEGFWDDFKAGYRTGKEDYIRKQAAKMGMTVPQAVQQAQAEPPGSNAPPNPTTPVKIDVKPKMSVRASTGATQRLAQQPTPSPSVSPTVSTPDYNNVLKTLDSLSKKEQQKILTQLLSRLGTPIS